jgi:hypothetical protein
MHKDSGQVSSSSTSKQKATKSSPYSVLNNPVQGEPSMCHSIRNPVDGLKLVYHGDNLQASSIDNSHGNSQDPQLVDSFTITRNPADSTPPYLASISLNTANDRKSFTTSTNIKRVTDSCPPAVPTPVTQVLILLSHSLISF